MSYDISGFGSYIDDKKSDYEKKGGSGIVLKENAPESAKKALKEYQKAQAKARKNGEKI